MNKNSQNSLLAGVLVILACVFAGCGEDTTSPTGPLSYLSLTVNVDKNVYYVGEYVTVYVQATMDCYLTLYNIDTQGEFSQIFPNQYASDNLLQGGVTYRIPTESDEFDFEVAGPPGTEQVQGICVTPDSDQEAEDTVTFQVVW